MKVRATKKLLAEARRYKKGDIFELKDEKNFRPRSMESLEPPKEKKVKKKAAPKPEPEVVESEELVESI